MKNFLNNIATKWWGFRWFLNSKKVIGLVLKIIVLLLIPEAFIFLFGLIDKFTPGSPNWFILMTFIIWAVLVVLTLTLTVWSIIRFIMSKKKNRR